MKPSERAFPRTYKEDKHILSLAFRQGIAYNKEYINKKRNGTNERSIAQRAVSEHG